MRVVSALTADGEERVGLLPLHAGHALQGGEAAPADVHPTLHLRLPEHGTEERDGDDVVLLLGGIHLLGAPEGKRLHLVDNELTGSPSYSSVVLFVFFSIRNLSTESLQNPHSAPEP